MQIASNAILVVPVAGGVAGLLARSVLAGLIGVLVAVAIVGLLVTSSARYRCIRLTAEGIVVRRNDYWMAVRWSDITAYRCVRFAGLLPVDVFDVRESFLFEDAALSTRLSAPLSEKVRRAGADHRIQIGTYVAGDDERITSMLSRHRPDLVAPGLAHASTHPGRSNR